MKSFLRFSIALMVSLFALTIFSSTWALAQTETVLYIFPVASDGLADGNPYAGPILDTKGNVYGTTVYGGAYGTGPYLSYLQAKMGNGRRQTSTVSTPMARTASDLIPAS
jgi:hypothetical protein